MTDTTTQSLADFLLARIAEDDAAARAAGTSWQATPYVDLDYYAERHESMVAGVDWPEGVSEEPIFRQAVAEHIARHDPARVLAECAAKRAIVELAEEASGLDAQIDGEFRVGPRDTATEPYVGDSILRALASVYADHAEFRAEWAL